MMDFELKPLTDPGNRLLRLAEKHAADFVTHADRHDRDKRFPTTMWQMTPSTR